MSGKPFLNAPALPNIPTANAAALRAVDDSFFVPGASAYIGTTRFYWDATSLAVDDGASVIKPTSVPLLSPGRWLVGPPSVPANTVQAVTNEAALTALALTGLQHGALAHVTSHDSHWTWLPGTGLAPLPNQRIDDQPTTGNWFRKPWPSGVAAARTSWTIDSAAANNEGVGDAFTPLQNVSELFRRVAPEGVWRPIGDVTVSLQQRGGTYQVPAIRIDQSLGRIIWRGIDFPPVADTFAATTARVPATNTQPNGQTTLPHGLVVGDFVLLGDDPAGTDVRAVVAVVVDANNIRLSLPIDAVTGVLGTDPSPGDRYGKASDVVQVNLNGDHDITGLNGTQTMYRYLNLTGAGTINGDVVVQASVVGVETGKGVIMRGCSVTGCRAHGNQFMACHVNDLTVNRGGSAGLLNCYLADPALLELVQVEPDAMCGILFGCIVNASGAAVAFVVSDGGGIEFTGGNCVYGDTCGWLVKLAHKADVYLLPTCSKFVAGTNDFLYSPVGSDYFPPIGAGGGAQPASSTIDDIADFEAAPFTSTIADHIIWPRRFIGL